MNSVFKMSYIYLFPILIALSGCLPVIKKEVIVAKPVELEQPPPVPLLPLETLQIRMDSLKNISQSSDLRDEERMLAHELLSDYEKAHNAAGSADCQKTIDVLFRSLEKHYQRLVSEGKKEDDLRYSNVLKEYTTREKDIIDKYLSEDYEGAIAKCRELENAFGSDSLTPEIGLIFSSSLAKSGLTRDAVETGEKVIRGLEGKPDIIHLRANVIEWLLDLGNRQKAVGVYEKLVDSLDERTSIYTKIKQKIEQEEDVSSPFEKDSQDEGIPEAHAAEDWHVEVNRMVKRGAYDEAKLSLLKRRLRTDDPSELELIEKALKDVEKAEQNKDTVSEETAKMELAIRLIEEENYEEAISRLDEFSFDQESPSEEIKRLRALAVEKQINSERNRAAKIFLDAKRSDDPMKKRGLLESSRDILKGLIYKYPKSNMIEKLQNNLNMVTKELNDLN
ncbi:MAG: hypothetical protein JW882_10665 [Deltaproteobacteria bacterium]|nr:hypothetical protein [Deltaproteobacteria bacterium]